MIHRMFTLLLALSIFTFHAHASSHEGLKAVFDELNYSLTVEWDQSDSDFYSSKLKAFQKEVEILQSKGLTNDQMLDLLRSEIQDEQITRDLEAAFTMISISKMSPSEATKYIMETMNKAYSTGASWSSKTQVRVGIIAFAMFVGAFVILKIANKDKELKCEAKWVCLDGNDRCFEDHCYYRY